MRSRLRIVSYNIHRGLSPFRKKEVLDSIAAVLHFTEADILCLQEDINSEFFNGSELEWRCREVWQNSIYGETIMAPGGTQGNTILSRFPVTNIENFDISASLGEARRLLTCNVQIGADRSIRVACTHLGLTRMQRRVQAAKLVRIMKSIAKADESLVLAGDFNDWREDLSPYFQQKLGLHDAYFHLYGCHCRTYPAWMPVLKLDRIYYRGLKVAAAWKVQQFGGRGHSDHLPLVVDFDEY
ncbi:MAG: endonuclease/exonuclease/phosphatase family protein [Oligoflexus sp.]